MTMSLANSRNLETWTVVQTGFARGVGKALLPSYDMLKRQIGSPRRWPTRMIGQGYVDQFSSILIEVICSEDSLFALAVLMSLSPASCILTMPLQCREDFWKGRSTRFQRRSLDTPNVSSLRCCSTQHIGPGRTALSYGRSYSSQ
jgi:hypothetical protein